MSNERRVPRTEQRVPSNEQRERLYAFPLEGSTESFWESVLLKGRSRECLS